MKNEIGIKNKLNLQLASFREAKELERAVGKALKSTHIQADLETDLLSSNVDVGTVISSLLEVVTSKEVEEKLFICAERCLYEKQKINEDFFEPVENRSLYYPIMIEILKANIGPFIESLVTMLPGLLKNREEDQKQK